MQSKNLSRDETPDTDCETHSLDGIEPMDLLLVTQDGNRPRDAKAHIPGDNSLTQCHTRIDQVPTLRPAITVAADDLCGHCDPETKVHGGRSADSLVAAVVGEETAKDLMTDGGVNVGEVGVPKGEGKGMDEAEARAGDIPQEAVNSLDDRAETADGIFAVFVREGDDEWETAPTIMFPAASSEKLLTRVHAQLVEFAEDTGVELDADIDPDEVLPDDRPLAEGGAADV